MRRVDGGGADGGATAAELAASDACMPGSRVRRYFVVGGLPHVAGNIGPSREAATPQSEPDNEFERNCGTSVGAEDPSTKDIGERIKAHSHRVIRVLEGGGHTHPQRPPFKQTT